MDYQGKSETTFRLSVWDSNRRGPGYKDPDAIPIVSEIVAENCTGMKLYLGLVAQANTTQLTVIQHDPSTDPMLQLNQLSDLDDSDAEKELLDAIEKPRTQPKRTAAINQMPMLKHGSTAYSMLKHVHLSDSDESFVDA